MSATADLRKYAEHKRLQIDGARGALDAVEHIRDDVQTLLDIDGADAAETLTEYVEALTQVVGHGLGVNDDDLARIQDAVRTLVDLLPDREALEVVVEAYEAADQAVATCEEHRDAERGEVDPDERQDAKDEAQGELVALADALDNAEPPPSSPPVMVSA